MYQFSVCFVFSFFVVASSFPVFEPTFGGGGIDLWLRMSQSNLNTPYPRQAGPLYDLHLRVLAQRRYNDILYLKPDSYLISVSTSIRAWSWLFYPEHPICITGDWSEPQTERRGPGLKLSWRQVVAMPYTPTKLSYETPCNFPTYLGGKSRTSDLSTSELWVHRNFGTSVCAQWYTYWAHYERLGSRYRSYLRGGRVG